VLFGDGAGAVVIGASNEPGIHSTHLHADGNLKDILFLPNDMAAPNLMVDTPYLHMQGKEVFKVAVNSLGQVAQEAVENNGSTHTEIDWLVPHQANIRIIEATAKKLNLPMSKVILTVANQGNSSAASIPLALDYGVRQNMIQRGHKVLLEAIGGGMTWGSILVTY
jgi:3-oxoacyl-[acyl-carrier-protein] synthase-3